MDLRTYHTLILSSHYRTDLVKQEISSSLSHGINVVHQIVQIDGLEQDLCTSSALTVLDMDLIPYLYCVRYEISLLYKYLGHHINMMPFTR